MSPVATHVDPEQAFHRATAWVARLESPDCTAEEADAFEDWLAEDPGHVHAWVQADALHREAAMLADDPWLRTSTARIPAACATRPWPRVAIAAGICLALGGAWMVVLDGNPTPQRYTNQTHQPLQQRLADGSVATLDARTAVTTRFGWRERNVDVEHGRIQLQVAPSSKTLRVHAGASSIRDIGTTFQVERRDDGVVEVVLLEGEVEVSSRGPAATRQTLQPGQQLSVLTSGRIQPGPAVSRTTAESWLHGELVFDATPLQQVVQRMNRYRTSPLVITDPRLTTLAVSGTFPAGDTDALVSALHLGWSISATRRADGAVELHRAP